MPTFRQDNKIGTKVAMMKTDDINDQAITKDKIRDGNVTTEKLADGAVSTDKIPDGAIKASKIADQSVTTGKIKDGSVTNKKIAHNSVSRAELTPDVRMSIDKKADAEQVNNLEKKIGDRFVVEGDVTNLPDEEDLTSVKESESDVLKLADRSYSPYNFSGKGYKILRKNIKPVSLVVTEIVVSSIPTSDGYLAFIINGVESHVDVVASSDTTTDLVAQKIAKKLTETMTEYEVSKDASTITLTRKFGGEVYSPSSFSAVNTGVSCSITDSTKKELRNILTPIMMNLPNTIYVIRYDFYLNGETIEIQEGCTLKFEGGILRGGKLSGKADIEASQIQIFEEIDLTELTFSSLDISWLGYKDGDDFGAFYNHIECLLPEASKLFYSKKIFIDSPAHITQKVYLSLKDIECRNYASDIFVLGTEEKAANEVNIKFNFLYSKNEDYLKSSNSGIKFINSSFCNISFEHIARIGYPINIVAKNNCGQNIFNWNIIEEGNIGIKYNAGESWTSAQWTEGTIYKFGFIRKFNVGIKWENNVRCNASIISGAIDCLEVADSYDIIDDSNDSEYDTGNIYFLNFVRHTRWKGRKNRDTILEPSYGISTAGEIRSAANIISKYVRLVNGAVEVFDPIAKMPRLDFYNSQNARVARINSNEDGGIDITPDTKDLNINNNIKVEQIKNKKGKTIIDLNREKPYIAGILQLDSLFCTGDVDSRYFKALGGGIKIYDQIAHLPRLDFFPEESGDYDGRIMLENGGFIIYTKNNFVKIIGGNQIVVPANTESYEVTFGVAKPNTNYNVILSPYCNTNCWIISQSKEGFVLGIKSSTIEQKIGYTIIGY